MRQPRVSNQEIKKINRNQIYRYISHYERVSKPEIAHALGLSMPTVLQNVAELVERGLVGEAGSFDSTGGRKAKVLIPVSGARFAIGIDITANHIGLVLTDLSGTVLTHTRMHKPFRNEDPYFLELGQLSLSFLEQAGRPLEDFLGFGISIPGIISQDNQVITHAHALRITNVPCRSFSQYIPYPCVFTNDANAAMIAEMFHHPDKLTAVYLSLSNSVGGAIFSETGNDFIRMPVFQNFFLGDNCRSGEFGHTTLFPGGTPCYCGKLGCVDSYSSALVLSRYAGGRLEDFFEGLPDRPEWRKTWQTYLDDLAIVVNNLRMTFDCQVIIGGYVGSFIEPFLESLRERVAQRNTF
jgi:predicted NBD/HSP70 family sugar kinase